MLGAVTIVNRFPDSIVCEGRHYHDTKDLSLSDVLLFIERDLFQIAKRFLDLRPRFALSLLKASHGVPQIRIGVSICASDNAQTLQKQIETILWSYNYQRLTACRGYLRPNAPRFRYHIDFTNIQTKPSGWHVVKGDADNV